MINYYSVANHLEENGWKLLSDTYKNLDTELEMVCPKGHRQSRTYKDWRKHPICDKCLAGDPFKGKKNNIPPKEEGIYRMIALDAATNVTGYAVYDNKQLVAYGVFQATPTKDTTGRINEVKRWLRAIIEESAPDFFALEDIHLEKYGPSATQYQVKTYNTLARLQGIILDTCFEGHIKYDLVHPSEWRRFCGINEGTGRDNKKKQAQNKVHMWYNIDCTNDEADAICIGKYFCNHLKAGTEMWGESFD